MISTPNVLEQRARSPHSWAAVALLLVAATLCSALLDPYVSLTSQAMLYVLVIVIASYKLDWVQSAVSLSEARALLRHQLPDIVVLDLGLPDGDGAQLVRELRKQHAHRVQAAGPAGTQRGPGSATGWPTPDPYAFLMPTGRQWPSVHN